MEEKIIHTYQFGLNITLDIYNNGTYEYTLPKLEKAEQNNFENEYKEIVEKSNADNLSRFQTFSLTTESVNKILSNHGFPTINPLIYRKLIK